MATIEERLTQLEAVEAIKRLKIRYAELNDEGFDPDGLVGLFTIDGVWDAGEFGRLVGRDAMREYWVETGRITSFAHHYITNHVVDVDPSGVTATGRCYLLGMSTREGQAYWMARALRRAVPQGRGPVVLPGDAPAPLVHDPVRDQLGRGPGLTPPPSRLLGTLERAYRAFPCQERRRVRGRGGGAG